MKSEVGEKERRTRNPTVRDRQPMMPFQGNKGVSTKTKKGRDGILGDQKLAETREKKVKASERVDATVESKVR